VLLTRGKADRAKDRSKERSLAGGLSLSD
jgi:hypothetical protein